MGRSLLRVFVDQVPTDPFVYFPLHYQPEASLLASAPVFQDQRAVVAMLSASLPAGFVLVVKDHPKMGGIRPPGFYRDLARFPNVVILPSSYPNATVLDQAVAVATIRGSVGFQALMLGKPVLLLGRVYYDCIHGCTRVGDLNDLPYVLKRLLVERPTREDDQRRSVLAFVKAFEQIKRKRIRAAEIETFDQKVESYAQLLAGLLEDEWSGACLPAGSLGGATDMEAVRP